MTLLALVVPLYRVYTSSPASDTLRVLCNWVLPLVALFLVSIFASSRIRGETNSQDREEASSLLHAEKESVVKGSPLVLSFTVVITISPVIVIAILSATDTRPLHYCP